MKFWVLLIALIAGCSSIKKEQNLSNSIKLEVEEFKLPNGLTTLLVRNSKLPIFSIQLFYRVGGKNEIPGITGSSHLLEHMMFKGGKKFGKNTMDFLIEGSGGSTNAYTTSDHTVYYENLPSTELEKILEIEADRMENLLLDPADFQKEKDVVLEERKLRYENQPRGQLYQEFIQNLFAGTPYGQPVIGEISDIKSVSREQVFNYFKKFYAPNNVVMVIVGDISIPDVKNLIRNKFAAIPSSPDVEKAHMSFKEDEFRPRLSESRMINRKGQSPNPMFMLGFASYEAGHPKGFALDILSSIIGSGKSGALMNDYIYVTKPVTTSIYAFNQSFEKSGMFIISGELVKGVKIPDFRDDLLKRLKHYCENEVTPRNLQKIKNNYLMGFYGNLDSNSGLASFLGERQLMFNDWKYYLKELNTYEQLTVEEVKSACHELMKQQHVFVSIWDKHI